MSIKTQDFIQLRPDQLLGREAYGNIDYVSDILSIPVPDASFDAILCTEVLEHVPEPIRVLHEFVRILKPGGKLLLTAPLGSGLHQDPYHFYGGYTPYWYSKFLQDAGFENVIIEPNGGFFKHYGQESIRFAKITIPWRLNANINIRLSWAPLWLILLIWFALICPVMCYFLDALDSEKRFTVGYNVIAKLR